MCDDTGYEIKRADANILWEMISNRCGATITIIETQYCKEDGGNIFFAQAKRGRERVEVSLFLGEFSCEMGPYDGLCYVGIRQRRWWWQKWTPLMVEIDTLVKAIAGQTRPQRQEKAGDPENET